MGNLNSTFANLLMIDDQRELEYYLKLFRQDLAQEEMESELILVEIMQFRLLRDDPVWKTLPKLTIKAHQVLSLNNHYMKRFREEVKIQNLGPLLEFIE